MTRTRVYSGTPWESRVAYCRATRIGNHVFVSGTVAVDEHGSVMGPGDVHAQARFALQRIERALGELGASIRDVVRTRTYLTNLAMFEDFARAHREVFAGIDPAATCVGVTQLVGPEFLVEIEVDAVVDVAP